VVVQSNEAVKALTRFNIREGDATIKQVVDGQASRHR
jgi:hypothetical protein